MGHPCRSHEQLLKIGDLVVYRGSHGPERGVVGVITSCTGEKSLIESKRSKGVYHQGYEVVWSLPGETKASWHPHFKLLLLSVAK